MLERPGGHKRVGPIRCTRIGCGSDPFHEVTAYWGIQFEINGLYYGWVQFETPELPPGIYANGGTILDWAYNSNPGQSILAGQVPEPVTVALFVAGAGLLDWRSRRRR